MAMSTNDRLIAAIAKYPGSPDFKIKCQDRHIDVHQTLICANSPLFAAELKHGFREELESVSEQDMFHVETVECMIMFVYLADYEVKAQKQSSGDDQVLSSSTPDGGSAADVHTDVMEQVLAHMRVWAIGDSYRIFKLRDLAAERFLGMIQAHWGGNLTPSSLNPTLHEASKHTLRHDDLRTSLYATLSPHMVGLIRDPTFISSLGAIDGLQEFAADLLPFAGNKLADPEQENDAQRSRKTELEAQLERKDLSLST